MVQQGRFNAAHKDCALLQFQVSSQRDPTIVHQQIRGKILDLIATITGWRRALLTIFAGAVVTLCLPPFYLLPAGFIGFPLLVMLIDPVSAPQQANISSRFKSGFRTGWLFGFGYFVAGLWWIGTALLVDAQAFAWAVPFAVLGLPAFLAIFYGFAVAIASLFWGAGFIRILVLAISFGITEWLRAIILTGFPWNALGYTMMPSPLWMQSVTLTSLYGMNSLAVLIFAMPVLLFGTAQQRFGWRSGMALAVILFTAHWGYGAWRLENAPQVDAQADIRANTDAPIIRLVQASIAQDAKWDDALRQSILNQHLELTTRPPLPGQPVPDVIIWPETAVPYVLPQADFAVKAMAQALQKNQVLLAGAVRAQLPQHSDPLAAFSGSTEPLYYNSIFTIQASGAISASADKVHLVPFGEYLPFENVLKSFGMQEVVELPGGFTAAPQRHSLAINSRLTLLPLICYEAIFPSELNYQGKIANAIINVTNDAWYGNTPGPYQHFQQAQLRAVEQGLPMLRAANNGISAIVDPYGRITAQLTLNQVGFVDHALPGKTTSFWGKPAGEQQFLIILFIMFALSCTFHVVRTKRFG